MNKLEELLDNSTSESTSGAFKSVEVFEYYVRKSVRYEASEGYKMTETEAKNHSWCYDDDDVFHYSWVQTEFDNYDNADPDECYQELVNEFSYVKRKSHLPIIVPILEGDEECYIMPRAKTFYEIVKKPIPPRVLKRRAKNIKTALVARIRQVGGKYFVPDISYRFNSLIELGISAGLSDDKIVKNLFWFVAEDAGSSLLRDMHKANICIYKGNLATFDAGQTYKNYNYSGSSIRKTHQTKVSDVYFGKRKF